RIGIGDYIGMVATRGKAHVLWTDTRRGKQEIYYGRATFEPNGGDAPPNDNCQTPRVIATLPYQDTLDTRQATTAPDDPQSCSGGQDGHSVWHSLTPAADTVYGIDTAVSDYDTVVSVYTGACGALTPVVCNDDFGSSINAANRSMLTFTARAGVTYLIEVSGKGGGGMLRLRLGAPTVTGVEFVKRGPDGTPALRITGAGFVNSSAKVILVRDGVENELPTITFTGDTQGDGTRTALFATKTKLKKLVKRDRPVTVLVESPVDSGNMSVPFTYTR
ncbi:MAG TPA: hypothetical protein VNO70_23005, partial [Blastocatellia bacterium]|nr:hypothetical protein [Blastocatellia bacterium]